MQNQAEGLPSAAAKVAPSAMGGGATILGVPLPDVVLWITLIYTALQIYIIIKDRFIGPRLKKKREVRFTRHKDKHNGR